MKTRRQRRTQPSDTLRILHAHATTTDDLVCFHSSPRVNGPRRGQRELILRVDVRHPEAELVRKVEAGTARSVALDERRHAKLFQATA